MPELPDITVYVERLAAKAAGDELQTVNLQSPFLLRTVEPPINDALGRRLLRVMRLGKRVVLVLDGDLCLVIHLMIAGRLRWRAASQKVPKTNLLATFGFSSGTLLLTEASKKKRVSLHVVQGLDGLDAHSRGGLEVLDATRVAFASALRAENHTVKRALTDPRILSGIGNAYSDEILWHAELSPFKQTQSLSDDEFARLYASVQAVLDKYTDLIRREVGDGFPDKVTAFRDDMAVHGRFKEPCPRCAAPVQRIVYADNEANYCARCQTGGKVLADRSLSRLLKANWPRNLDELD